jgi:hypothetical protein
MTGNILRHSERSEESVLRSNSERMRVSPPQEPSSFFSCWGTRYSFFSRRKEKKE